MLRHFIDTQDFSKAELLEMIELTRRIKAADKQGCTPKLLQDASLAMIFEEPSTRTRVSFEVAMTELGGHALYLKPGEIHLGVRESMYDTAKVLSRMCDGIFARTLKHATITELAKHAEVPVINGLTDYNHPTQVVCDVTTMIEHMPAGKRLEDLNVTFIGDATNVLSSLMLICTRMGMHFTHAAPKKYQAPAEWQAWARAQLCRVGRHADRDRRPGGGGQRGRFHLHRPVVVGGAGRPDPRAAGGFHARLPGQPGAVQQGACALQVYALPASLARRGSHR